MAKKPTPPKPPKGPQKVVNKQAIQQYIRKAYEAYRKENAESLPEFKWTDVEEAAMKLVSEHSEQILRCASSMAGVYQRKLQKDARNKVDLSKLTSQNAPQGSPDPTEPTDPQLA